MHIAVTEKGNRTMYEELVIALRTCVDKDKGCSECPYYAKKCMYNTNGKHPAMVDAADAIEKLSKPVVRGKWHDHYQIDSEYAVATCSACGCSSSFTDMWLSPYCPMCGAEMEDDDG